MTYTVTITTHTDYFKDQWSDTETRIFQTKEEAYKLAALRYMDAICNWDHFTEDDVLPLLQGKVAEFVKLMEDHFHFDGEYIPRRIEIQIIDSVEETLSSRDIERYENHIKELTDGYFPDGLPDEGV